jgi:hypothetical protein
VHGEDVRVLQAGGQRDLAPKARGPEARGQWLVQHFERDGAIVLVIVGQKYGRHAAATDLALDRISRPQTRLQLI